MTARRSSATERRGVGGFTPRPAALPVVVLAVTLAGSGCASRNVNTTGMVAPLNQDTAAVAKDGGLPHVPPVPQQARFAGNTVTALPSVTDVLPPGTNPTDTTGTNLADQIKQKLLAGPLTIGLTPEQNPASPKPPLEVVGMPAWLWIEGLPPALQTTVTPAGSTTSYTITDQAVVDQVEWSTDQGGPTFTCGAGTATPAPSPSPGKAYGIPYDLAFDPTASGVPNACVNTFSAPLYSTSNGKTVAGTYQLSAKVYWHISCTVLDNTAKTATTPNLGANYTGNVLTNPTPIRVGEIQALAISP